MTERTTKKKKKKNKRRRKKTANNNDNTTMFVTNRILLYFSSELSIKGVVCGRDAYTPKTGEKQLIIWFSWIASIFECFVPLAFQSFWPVVVCIRE
jgi:hypothetical protein